MSISERTAASTFDRVSIDLTHEAFPELAAAIRARSDRILKHWRELSLKAMPHLDRLTLVEFENTVAIILAAAADAFESCDPPRLRGVMESGPQHGIDRFIQRHSLLDLFEEVRILRGVVILELAQGMKRPLSVGEAATFHAIFDIIIQQGVMALVQKQQELLIHSQSTAVEMNQQLMVSMVRQNELLEQAHNAEEALQHSEHHLATELDATRALQEISAHLIKAGDTQELYQHVVDAASDIMRSDMASMQIVDEARNGLRMLAFRGFDPEFGRVFEFNGADAKTSCAVARRTGQRVIVPDVETCEFIVNSPGGDLAAHRKTGIRSVQSTPLFSREGRVLGMISTHWRRPLEPGEPSGDDLRRFDILARQAADLLERRQAEEALRESEERYRTLFELGPVAIYSIDTRGVIDNFNQQAARLWGQAPGIGDTDQRFCGSFKMFRPDGTYMPHDACPMAEVVSGRVSEVRDGEVVIERPDGSRATVIVNIRSLKNQRGEVTGAVNCFYDISDRKRAEVAMARLAAIVESSEDAIISKDLSGIITTWNRGAQHLFGYTAEEMVGKPISLLIPEDHIGEEPQILGRMARGESIEHFETVRRRKDGTLLNISLTVSPVRDGAGRIIGASKIAHDITDRVALENKVKQQAEALASESRRKDEFLAMLSHELRNPLAPIRSAIHVLKMQERTGAESAIQKQAHDIIDRQVANLTKLVSDLLEVSRVISGRVRLDLQVIDINQVVQHAMETVRPLVQQRGHEMVFNCCPMPIWANADASRLEEVFVNLLNNAAKYTPDGGRIDVWCEHPEGKDFVQMRVRDTGVGIDAKLLPRIFDLFTQADRSLDRSAGGLGIGLSLAHRIVDLHGGTIEAHSPPVDAPDRVGTEFIVKLPMVTSPPEMHLSPNRPEADGANHDGVRVLVVDDNTDMVLMLTSALRQKGFSVQSAYTGPDGLKVARQWRPNVILLDIGLPGLDGYEVARRIRADAALEHKQPRLIALTGYGREADIALAQDAGFNAHLIKPYEFEELEKVMASTSNQM